MIIENRVVITGIGAVSPLGSTINDVWSRIILGQCAVKLLPDAYNNFPCRIASEIEEVDWNEIQGKVLKSSESKSMSRASVLMMKAACEALTWAGIDESNSANNDRYGVSLGIGFDGVATSTEAGQFSGDARPPYASVGPYALTRALGNMPAAHISVRFRFRGPSRSVNSACAAGLHAIGDAYRSVRDGEIDLALAGGVEASVSPWSIAAFSRIRALATKWNDCPQRASRPFDVERAGFVMAEGAGAVVVESLSSAKKRGKLPLAEILGFGQSCDGCGLVAPDRSGDGAYRSMRAAVESAKIGPEQVSYINCHATSTPIGDLVECHAVEKLFGLTPVVSSFKGQLGHCLGGSGAIETALVVKSVMEEQIPPNGNLQKPDPNIHVRLIPGNCKPFAWTDRKKILLKNSFGFGGTNCSIVMGSFIP